MIQWTGLAPWEFEFQCFDLYLGRPPVGICSKLPLKLLPLDARQNPATRAITMRINVSLVPGNTLKGWSLKLLLSIVF